MEHVFKVQYTGRKGQKYKSDGRQKSTFQKTTMIISSNQLETARKSETPLNDVDALYDPSSSFRSVDNIHIPLSYGNNKKSIELMSL